MTKKKIDYSKTEIYKLKHNDDINNENIYIGSTTNFRQRKNQHKQRCNSEKSEKFNLKVYQNIRLNGGWEEWSMLLVEKFQCIEKNESLVRERFWFDYYKSQLNTRIPGRTNDEWRNDHKEEIIEKQKVYNKDHKEEAKLYYNNNKIIINEKQKTKYEKNKKEINEKAKEKIECECGCVVTKKDLNNHKKTESHKILMLKKNINN